MTACDAERPRPFDPARIEQPANARVDIDIGEIQIMEQAVPGQLAGAITDGRDNVNVQCRDKHGEKLMLLDEERALLQLFRPAGALEKISSRVCAPANLTSRLNVTCLRQLTRTNNKEDGSITLYKRRLQKEGKLDAVIADTMRDIMIKLRQGYPVHSDRAQRALQAHAYFQLQYPAAEHPSAGVKPLSRYNGRSQRDFEYPKGTTFFEPVDNSQNKTRPHPLKNNPGKSIQLSQPIYSPFATSPTASTAHVFQATMNSKLPHRPLNDFALLIFVASLSQECQISRSDPVAIA